MGDFIGVIDSGVGGLTILRQLTKDNNCNFVYIADHAFCPYGTKSPEVVLRRITTLVSYLADSGASSVVIACNTASRFAETLSIMFKFPIYEVITPTCNKIIAAQNKRVALLATKGTIDGRLYHKLLEPNGITVFDFPCSSFVPFIEQNAMSTLLCHKAVDEALFKLQQLNVDAVVLACTHFPLIRNQISYYCNNAKIVECCCNIPLINRSTEAERTISYYTTGNVEFAQNASKWYDDVNFKHLSL